MNILFEKSFASHDKAKYWSNKNELKPEQVNKSSHKKYWFDCECGHIFNATPAAISRGNWCPYCCYPSIKLCDKEDCKHCFDKSFASHPMAARWSAANSKTPRQVLKGSHSSFEFNCSCGHTYENVLYSFNTGGTGCSYCGNKKLCNDDNCKKCFQKSLASSSLNSEIYIELLLS